MHSLMRLIGFSRPLQLPLPSFDRLQLSNSVFDPLRLPDGLPATVLVRLDFRLESITYLP